MRRTAIILGVMTGFTVPSFAASLSDFTGIWRGKGTYSQGGASEKQGRLTCKLTIEAEGANSIVVNGRCAAPEGSRGFKTLITDNGNGYLSGTELSRLNARQERRSGGTLTGSGIDLTGEDEDGSYNFSLTILKSGQIQMKSGTNEGEKSETADVLLRQVTQ